MAESPKVPIPNKPGVSNWVEDSGGLPNYIRRIAEHLKGKGHSTSSAIAMAVNTVKRWAKGTNHNGSKLKAATVAKAAAAVAAWEKLKGKQQAKDMMKGVRATPEELDGLRLEEQRNLERLLGLHESIASDPRALAVGLVAQHFGEPAAKLGLLEAMAPADPDETGRLLERLESEIDELAPFVEMLGGPPAELAEARRGTKATAPAVSPKHDEAAEKGPDADNDGDEPPRPMVADHGDPEKNRAAHLQRRLGSLGIETTDDGHFGPKTADSVRTFQAQAGLKEDGIVGPKTTEALKLAPHPQEVEDPEDQAEGAGGPAGAPQTPVAAPAAPGAGSVKRKPKPFLHKGMGVGESPKPEVKDLQAHLEELGYPSIELDGAFGPQTEDITKRFQKKMGLKSDGLVGPKTMKTIKGLTKRLSEAVDARKSAVTGDEFIAARAREQVVRRQIEEGFYVETVEAHRLVEANAGLEKLIALLTAKGLSPEQAMAVIAKGFDKKAGMTKTARGMNRAKVAAKLKRLDDGTFAPKGQGQILKPGMSVDAGGTHGIVAAVGNKGVAGEALGADDIQIAKADGGFEKLSLKPKSAQLDEKPFVPDLAEVPSPKESPGTGSGKVSSLSDDEKSALVKEIHAYAEGVDENLRDDYAMGDEEPPETFPVVEDMLGDADRIEMGEDPIHDTLEQVADQAPEGADPALATALTKMGHSLGYEPKQSPGTGDAGKQKYLDAKKAVADAKAAGASKEELAKLAKAARKAKKEGKAALAGDKPKAKAKKTPKEPNKPPGAMAGQGLQWAYTVKTGDTIEYDGKQYSVSGETGDGTNQSIEIVPADGAGEAITLDPSTVVKKIPAPKAAKPKKDKPLSDLAIDDGKGGKMLPPASEPSYPDTPDTPDGGEAGAIKNLKVGEQIKLKNGMTVSRQAENSYVLKNHDGSAAGAVKNAEWTIKNLEGHLDSENTPRPKEATPEEKPEPVGVGHKLADKHGTEAEVIDVKGDPESDDAKFTFKLPNGNTTTIGYKKMGDIAAGKAAHNKGKKPKVDPFSDDQIGDALSKSLAATKGGKKPKSPSLDTNPDGTPKNPGKQVPDSANPDVKSHPATADGVIVDDEAAMTKELADLPGDDAYQGPDNEWEKVWISKTVDEDGGEEYEVVTNADDETPESPGGPNNPDVGTVFDNPDDALKTALAIEGGDPSGGSQAGGPMDDPFNDDAIAEELKALGNDDPSPGLMSAARSQLENAQEDADLDTAAWKKAISKASEDYHDAPDLYDADAPDPGFDEPTPLDELSSGELMSKARELAGELGAEDGMDEDALHDAVEEFGQTGAGKDEDYFRDLIQKHLDAADEEMGAGDGEAASDPAQAALDAYKASGGDDPAVIASLESKLAKPEPKAEAKNAALDAYKAAGGDDPEIIVSLGGGPLDIPDAGFTDPEQEEEAAFADDVENGFSQPDDTELSTDPASAAAQGGFSGGLVPNDQGLALENMQPGTVFKMQGGKNHGKLFAYHKPTSGGTFHVVKPVDGGKSTVFHGKMQPPEIDLSGAEGGDAPEVPTPTPAPTNDDALYDSLAKSVDAAKAAKAANKAAGVNTAPGKKKSQADKAFVASASGNAALAESPGRGPSGKVRNFKAMGAKKLQGVIAELEAFGADPEALMAAQSALAGKL